MLIAYSETLFLLRTTRLDSYLFLTCDPQIKAYLLPYSIDLSGLAIRRLFV